MSPLLFALSLLGCKPCLEGSLSSTLDPALPAEPAHQGPAAGLIYEIYVRSFQDSDGDGIGDQSADPGSMLNLVRALSCLRAAHGLDEDATWEPSASGSLLSFTRDEGRLSVRVNLSERPSGGLAAWGYEVEGDAACS